MKYRGFRFQFCLKPIHWLISSFGGASNAAKEGLSGPSDGWSWTMSPVKIRQQHLSKINVHPFFHLLKIFGWWIWVEFSESVSLTWVPGVMFCVFLMHTSTILRYFETLQTVGTLLSHFTYAAVVTACCHLSRLDYKTSCWTSWLKRQLVVSWCHGVLRITNRDVFPTLFGIKDTAVPWSRSIHFQERPDLAEEKARLVVEGASAGRGFSSHGGSPVVTMG